MAKKAGSKSSSKTSARMRYNTYSTYLNRLLKQRHPGTGISSRALAVLESISQETISRLTRGASNFAEAAGEKTLSARSLASAVHVMLPGELGQHAHAAGQRAVARAKGK